MKFISAIAVTAALTLSLFGRADAKNIAGSATSYCTEQVDGIQIFYREAGPIGAPTIVLLHGFPSSSHMFRDLIPKLATRYHVIAPDYPGFGYSEAPDESVFKPTFDNLAVVMEHFLEQRGIKHAVFYLQDFGGPVGLRIAAHHPEKVRALIIQNANAYMEGVAPPIKESSEARRSKATPVEEMKFELGSGLTDLLYKQGVRNLKKVSPDSYSFDHWAMSQPGHRRIGAALINDYHSNFDLYPQWQAYFRQHQPATLLVWGKGDPIFLQVGAETYRRDLKHVDIKYFDTGHFALEEAAEPIAAEVLRFLATRSVR